MANYNFQDCKLCQPESITIKGLLLYNKASSEINGSKVQALKQRHFLLSFTDCSRISVIFTPGKNMSILVHLLPSYFNHRSSFTNPILKPGLKKLPKVCFSFLAS